MSDGEKCQRCGAVGEDRRTLAMKCFYDMNEMDVPFDTKVLFSIAENKDDMDIDIVEDKGSITLSNGREIILKPVKLRVNEIVVPHELFTLRVCKRCRAEWLGAIEGWFHARGEEPTVGG